MNLIHLKIKAKCAFNNRGLKHEENKIGMKRNTIYQQLKKGTISNFTLKKISHALGINYEFLIDNSNTNLLE